MNKQLTAEETEKIRKLCFANPAKACAVAQEIIDTCQVVSCATYAGIVGRSTRTIQTQATKLVGIELPDRNYISVNQ